MDEKERISVEKDKKSEKDTVEVRKYGAILTKFVKEEIFETETGLQIKVRQDSIMKNYFQLVCRCRTKRKLK